MDTEGFIQVELSRNWEEIGKIRQGIDEEEDFLVTEYHYDKLADGHIALMAVAIALATMLNAYRNDGTLAVCWNGLEEVLTNHLEMANMELGDREEL